MTQIYFPNSFPFIVTETDTTQEKHGIIRRIGRFADQPNLIQIVTINTPEGPRHFPKSPTFFPLAIDTVQGITQKVAKELNLKIEHQNTDGINYWATLLSPEIKGEVEGDLVAFGIRVTFSVLGNFKTSHYFLRLACLNGWKKPVDTKIAIIPKSYDVDAMTEAFLNNARFLEERFNKELERLKQYGRYQMTQELAELLAQNFPQPIINDFITKRKDEQNKIVIEYKPVTLKKALEAMTYQTSHRNLSDITKDQWDTKMIRIFDKFIEEQEVQTA